MNQHYVSQVLLRRFKRLENPLQRYRVGTDDWKPANPRNVFSARGWNQLRIYDQIDDSLETEFSKVETVLPQTLNVLEAAARVSLTQLPENILKNISQYCAFLWLTSPFAKAKAPADFLCQVNYDLEHGESDLLRRLSFSEETINAFCKARTLGQHAILYSDDSIQVVYRIQFRELYPGNFVQFLRWTEWTICNSPIELPLSDIALVQLYRQDHNAIYYVLPIGPNLLLKGKRKLGAHNESVPAQIRGEDLSTKEAEYWLEIICFSAVTELVSSQIIWDIAKIRERAKVNGITFPTIVNPQRGASVGLTEFKADFGLRMVSQPEYVRYVHSFLKPTPPIESANKQA